MNDLLAARKIPYFEFIQPNQYYATKRQFSADEKKIAFDENSTFKEPTIKGYPKLLARIDSVKGRWCYRFQCRKCFRRDQGYCVYG